MAEQTHNTDMSDEPHRQDLEDRVEQLEATIAKMLPSRRDALKLGGAALVGGAAMSGSASAGTSQAGTIGTAGSPVDLNAEDIEADTVSVSTVGASTELSSQQSVPENTITRLQFDTVVFDDFSAFDTNAHEFVVPEEGTYVIQAQANFFFPPDGTLLSLFINKNGGSIGDVFDEGGQTSQTVLNNTVISRFSLGETTSVDVRHEASGDLTVNDPFRQTSFTVARIG